MGLDDRSAPRPQWLTATEGTTVQDDFLGGVSSGTGVHVEPDQLKSFSTGTTAQAQAFQQAFANGVQSLLMSANQIGASTPEAAALSAEHAALAQQLSAFAQEAGIGLMALGQAAETIAINYVDSDATQSATLDQVTSAFSPPPGSDQSLRALMTGATDPGVEVTEEDQAVADAIALPAPDDLTPDQDAPDPADDPRASRQEIALGDSGDTYVIPADDDIELIDQLDAARDDAARITDDGDHALVDQE